MPGGDFARVERGGGEVWRESADVTDDDLLGRLKLPASSLDCARAAVVGDLERESSRRICRPTLPALCQATRQPVVPVVPVVSGSTSAGSAWKICNLACNAYKAIQPLRQAW